MNTAKRMRKTIAGLLAVFVLAVMGAGMGAAPVKAASGSVYTCVIHPCYAHPVTGVIEDSGGEASYTTGQGMADGAVYTTGILEMTDSGEYYLTIRMSLMDYTSNHSFWVQNVGDSGWSAPAVGVTGNGTDSNGTTADICIRVPSENCVVRGSMYVQPMGRDVIFYLYPSDYTAGNNTDLISVITSDIELLEVFYAHTISPVAIAVLTSLVMIAFIGSISPAAAILALAGYLAVGAVIPLYFGKKGADKGMAFRNGFGELNSFILDSLRGLDETIQYGQGEKRRKEMEVRSDRLAGTQRELNHLEAGQRSVTNLTILIFSFAMLFLMIALNRAGSVDMTGMLTGTIAMMASFGPVTALAGLSNNLNQTLASGERVLSVLEEEPIVAEVSGAERVSFTDAQADNVDFAYGKEQILKDYSIHIPKGKVVGICGASGSGKSTLLKLLMRFRDVQGGTIRISGRDVRGINTENLREMESYVTQETVLFHDSIANNIAVGKPGASRKEIMEAAGKASIHDFIMKLPKGYDTEVGELGDTLSGGERQRIGIARAFLHDAPFLLLDEPTSNLDSLNEGIILKSLKEEKGDRTVILVSHRKSTMNLADVAYKMDHGRLS